MKTIRVLFSILIISTVINSTNCFSKTKSTSKIFDRTAWIPADFNQTRASMQPCFVRMRTCVEIYSAQVHHANYYAAYLRE